MIISIPVELTKIPTAIARYTPVLMDGIFPWYEATFKRSINIWEKEVLRVYNRPHIAIRWSPIKIALERLFGG